MREIARDRFQPVDQIRRRLLMQKRRFLEACARAALALAYKPWLEWAQRSLGGRLDRRHERSLSRGCGVPETRVRLAAVRPDLAAAVVAIGRARRSPGRHRSGALERASIHRRAALLSMRVP